MSKRIRFSNSTVINPRRYTLLINRFYGVDLTDPQMLVSDRRGVYSINYLYDNGSVVKRHGRECVAICPSDSYYPMTFEGVRSEKQTQNPNVCHGMWHFVAEDGKEHIVCHIGRLLYEMRLGDMAEFSLIGGSKTIEGEMYAYEFKDERSEAFVGNRKLWFLGGNAYVCVRFPSRNKSEVNVVSESDFAFIPTTSIGITCDESETQSRSGLDYPNSLSPFRRNLLLSGTKKQSGYEDSAEWNYTLDAPIVLKSGSEAEQIKYCFVSITEK